MNDSISSVQAARRNESLIGIQQLASKKFFDRELTKTKLKTSINSMGFTLLIQIIYSYFAPIKSNSYKWDYLTGLHKK